MYPEHVQEERAPALGNHVHLALQTFASWKRSYSEQGQSVPFKTKSLGHGSSCPVVLGGISQPGICCYLASKTPLVLAGFLSRSSYLIFILWTLCILPVHSFGSKQPNSFPVAYNWELCFIHTVCHFFLKLRMVGS